MIESQKGFQHDLIEATVVVQKVGTFDKNNRVSRETKIISTYKASSIHSMSSWEKQ